jgi:hypothetical protein
MKRFREGHGILLMCFSAIFVFFCTVSFAHSEGIEVKTPHNRIDIHHLSDPPYATYENVESLFLADRTPSFRVPNDSTTYLYIMDGNPLLFKYSNEVTIEDSPDYLAVKKLLEIIQVFVGSLSNKDIASPIPLNAIYAEEIKKTIIEYEEDIRPILEQTCGSSDELWVAMKKVGGEPRNIIGLASSIEDLNSQVEKIWDLRKLEDDIEILYEGAVDDPKKGEFLKLLTFLKTFKKDVLSINLPYKLPKMIDIRDTRKSHTSSIKIEPNNTYAGYFSTKVLETQQKGSNQKLALKFQRKSIVRYAPSMGIVYSFVEDPEYKVKEDSEGNRTIAESSSDYKEFSVGATVNIIPDGLFETNFEPFLQLGASADGDDIGLLLGVGLSLFPFPDNEGDIKRSLTVAGGLIWQQVEELSGGLNVGDSIKTDDELKTDDKFDSGFYLMLGVNF